MNARFESECHTCPDKSDCEGSVLPPVTAALRDLANFVISHGPRREVSCRRVEEVSGLPLRIAARQLAAARKNRARSLAPNLLGEPAWDILLELFGQDEPQSIKSVCLGAGVPLTSTLRWLNLLEQRALVRQFADPNDARRTLVTLSAEGAAAVAAAVEGFRSIVLGLFPPGPTGRAEVRDHQ